MPLSIFNIVIPAPVVQSISSERFFYQWPATGPITAPLVIDAADFTDDTGADATAFPALTNGYYNFYINGVMQEQGTYAVTTTTLTINTSSTGDIIEDTVLIVEAIQLA